MDNTEGKEEQELEQKKQTCEEYEELASDEKAKNKYIADINEKLKKFKKRNGKFFKDLCVKLERSLALIKELKKKSEEERKSFYKQISTDLFARHKQRLERTFLVGEFGQTVTPISRNQAYDTVIEVMVTLMFEDFQDNAMQEKFNVLVVLKSILFA